VYRAITPTRLAETQPMKQIPEAIGGKAALAEALVGDGRLDEVCAAIDEAITNALEEGDSQNWYVAELFRIGIGTLSRRSGITPPRRRRIASVRRARWPGGKARCSGSFGSRSVSRPCK
jgi:hypothetical protein